MFVPKLAVPERKQLDSVKVNLAPNLVRVKTNNNNNNIYYLKSAISKNAQSAVQ